LKMAGLDQEEIDQLDAESIKVELEEAKKVYDYLPPYVWANYELYNITGLAEQILLDEKLNTLRRKAKECLIQKSKSLQANQSSTRRKKKSSQQKPEPKNTAD
jgi:hypothetical protein